MNALSALLVTDHLNDLLKEAAEERRRALARTGSGGSTSVPPRPNRTAQRLMSVARHLRRLAHPRRREPAGA